MSVRTLLDLDRLSVRMWSADTVTITGDALAIEVDAADLDLLIVALQQARTNVFANPAPTFTPPQREF